MPQLASYATVCAALQVWDLGQGQAVQRIPSAHGDQSVMQLLAYDVSGWLGVCTVMWCHARNIIDDVSATSIAFGHGHEHGAASRTHLRWVLLWRKQVVSKFRLVSSMTRAAARTRADRVTRMVISIWSRQTAGLGSSSCPQRACRRRPLGGPLAPWQLLST